jgi:hypothetical protein
MVALCRIAITPATLPSPRQFTLKLAVKFASQEMLGFYRMEEQQATGQQHEAGGEKKDINQVVAP